MKKHTEADAALNLVQAVRDMLRQRCSSNETTESVLDNILARLEEKGSMTPKQTLWMVQTIAKHSQGDEAEATEKLAQLMEPGGTQDQRDAERKVDAQLKQILSHKPKNNFGELFQFSDDEILMELAKRLRR
jgi:hypothetical protein